MLHLQRLPGKLITIFFQAEVLSGDIVTWRCEEEETPHDVVAESDLWVQRSVSGDLLWLWRLFGVH